MNKYIVLLIISLVLFTISCRKQREITIEHKFRNQIWNAFDKAKFDTRISDKENAYQLSLEIELTSRFQAVNFDFGMSQTNDDGESRYSNYSIQVKDSLGKLNGEKTDELFKYILILQKKTYFNSDSIYHFIFESTMNKYDVEGVNGIKLVIEER